MKPLPPFANGSRGRYLTTPEFSERFAVLANGVTSRFFKYERLQRYHEPDNLSLREFLKGNVDAAIERIADERALDATYYLDSARRDLLHVRVRAVEFPLTDYLLWEFKTYQVSARWGERILAFDLPTLGDRDSDLRSASDFVLFDGMAALLHDYDASGVQHGGWLVEGPEAVAPLSALSQRLRTVAVPLALFEREHRMG